MWCRRVVPLLLLVWWFSDCQRQRDRDLVVDVETREVWKQMSMRWCSDSISALLGEAALHLDKIQKESRELDSPEEYAARMKMTRARSREYWEHLRRGVNRPSQLTISRREKLFIFEKGLPYFERVTAEGHYSSMEEMLITATVAFDNDNTLLERPRSHWCAKFAEGRKPGEDRVDAAKRVMKTHLYGGGPQ